MRKARQNVIHCYFHQSDMDGFTSGWLIKWAFENAFVKNPFKDFRVMMHRYNYGFYINENQIEPQDMVILVDCSFPKEDMEYVKNKVKGKMLWMDHHITVLDEMEGFDVPGDRGEEFAGCRHTFNWIKRNRTELGKKLGETYWDNLQRFVDCIDIYDRFDKSDSILWTEALNMNFAFSALNTDPSTEAGLKFWNLIDEACDSSDKITEMIEDFDYDGALIYASHKERNRQLVNAYGFEGQISGFEHIGLGLFLNQGIGGSLIFEDSVDWDKHDYVGCFVYSGKKNLWSVSLYSEKEDVDLTPIFNYYNGGGHRGAGGMRVREFKYVSTNKKLFFSS